VRYLSTILCFTLIYSSLFAQETLTILDEDTQEAFIELLFQECKEVQTTLVFVSHDTRFSKLFDRTIKLKSLENEETQQLVEGGRL
jgi:putative ABC transport system ATP-binding protein